MLYIFTCILIRHFQRTRQPPDLDYGIKSAAALDYKRQLEPNSEQKNIEMLTLYLTCFPWDPLEGHTASVLARLALAVATRTGQSERLEEVVGCLYEGRKLCPFKDLPELDIIMAFVLTWQRCHTNVANEVQEIMAMFNENIPRLRPGHYVLTNRPNWNGATGSFLVHRSHIIGQPP